MPATGRPLAAAILISLGACGSDEPVVGAKPEPEAIVAAHYYTWYQPGSADGHWHLGTFRQPLLGQYSSADPQVAARHVDWASAAGIDVLAVNWSPPASIEQSLLSGLLQAPNLHKIRYCLFYDIANRLPQLGSRDLMRIDFDRERVRLGVLEDLTRLAAEHFGHPQYFRIRSRPVLWLYLTRNYRGAWAETLDELRRRTAAQGHPVYIVADEAWYDNEPGPKIRAFDAVSAYNPYDPVQMRHRTHWGLADFAALYRPVYQRWLAEAPLQSSHAHGMPVPFMPAVLPGYDDRAFHRRTNPPVVAASLQEVRDVLVEARQMALVNAHPEERVVWITSFNEWHEGTAVEPSDPSGPPDGPVPRGFELLQLLSEVFGGTMAPLGSSASGGGR
jgi:hypothetical protein